MVIAAFVIGLVGLLMAILPYIQQLITQPKIGVSFDYDDGAEDGRVLRMHLMNRPSDNRLLQMLKMFRLTAEHVYLALQVFSTSTGEAVSGQFLPDIVLYPSDKGCVVNLPASYLQRNVRLVKWQRSTNSAVLLANRDIPLGEGSYIVSIVIEVHGKVTKLGEATFHVGATETETTWREGLTGKIAFM
jgi:hypothetical protein